MRKENSRRKRTTTTRENRSDRVERSDFRRDDKSTFGGKKRVFGERKADNSFSPDRKKKFGERPPGNDRKDFREFKKREEEIPFDKKKKYADRNAKIAKNKRKFDYGQDFTNKKSESSPERPKREGFNRDKPRTFGGRKKTFGKSDSFEKRDDRSERRGSSKPSGSSYEKREGPFGKKDYRTERKSSAIQEPSDSGLIRLNRYISNAGICSRREADDMIVAGLVSVNGEIVTKLGTKVSPNDIVKYDNATLKRERNVYLLLNKPKDYITTVDDPEKRNTVMELIAGACKERVYPVGRLDRNTTGVLLFTNDGELAKRLTHPSSNIKKIYHVELDKNLSYEDMKKISSGIELEDGMAAVDEIAYDHPTDKKYVGIEIHMGKKRIVRRIFEALGYEVRRLDRVVFAGLTKKDLPRGRWRLLTHLEVSSLKMMTGRKKHKEEVIDE